MALNLCVGLDVFRPSPPWLVNYSAYGFHTQADQLQLPFLVFLSSSGLANCFALAFGELRGVSATRRPKLDYLRRAELVHLGGGVMLSSLHALELIKQATQRKVNKSYPEAQR